MELFLLAILLFILVTISIIGIYNGLIEKESFVENAMAGIDVQLKTRFDLIPNLVEVAKHYMIQEKSLFEKIAQVRGKTVLAKESIEGAAEVDKEISLCLKQFMVSVENYPVLKSNENFLHLQESLFEVEAQLSAARRTFNSAVMEYNNAVLMFPSNVMALFLGMKKRALFSIPENEKQNIKISFN